MITVSKGDTFQLKCRFKAGATAPTSLAGYTITSMVKTSDGVRHVAAVTFDTQPSAAWFVRIESAVTSKWPGGRDENDPASHAEWDCKVVKDGVTIHTQRAPVTVLNSVTV
jgi:hypothetical protein